MKEKLMNNRLIQQIMKFAVVGATAFLIDYGIMILLTEVFSIHYLISSAISFTVSVIYNYILSLYWVFDVNNDQSKTTNFIIFIVLSVIGLLINQLMMWLCVDITNLMPYFIAKIFATAVVMVYNFVSRKLFLEKKA